MDIPGFIENGIWKAICPACSTSCQVDPTSNTVICAHCYPSIKANALRQISGGLFRPVPDVEIRTAARAQAQADGNIHTVIYPDDRVAIETALRARPSKYNMNWYHENHPALARIGKTIETLDDLLAENAFHGVI